jgi:fructose-1,6-bisphosphatase I
MSEQNSQFKDFHTLESHIAQGQKLHPESRGVFSNLLRRIGLASKIIGSKVQRAGLLDVLGVQGNVNVQGEEQMKLDVLALEVVKATMSWMPSVAGFGNEEEDEITVLPPRPEGHGKYVVLFDPLDGSSNIDANVSVGTIFSIYKRVSNGPQCTIEDFLQPGTKQEAAGYVIYGSSTMFVYTTGHGVHGFTLDPEVGEYILSHENIRIPDRCKCFSTNDSNYRKWDAPTQKFADHIRYSDAERYAKTSSRYIGSLVSDFHRNLLYGGVFMYPADKNTGKGKLRLLYELNPMSLLAEQAGGASTTGTKRMLEIDPTELHQREPVVIGNKTEVKLYEKMVKEHKAQQ